MSFTSGQRRSNERTELGLRRKRKPVPAFKSNPRISISIHHLTSLYSSGEIGSHLSMSFFSALVGPRLSVRAKIVQRKFQNSDKARVSFSLSLEEGDKEGALSSFFNFLSGLFFISPAELASSSRELAGSSTNNGWAPADRFAKAE